MSYSIVVLCGPQHVCSLGSWIGRARIQRLIQFDLKTNSTCECDVT